jgi:hypothetical protein
MAEAIDKLFLCGGAKESFTDFFHWLLGTTPNQIESDPFFISYADSHRTGKTVGWPSTQILTLLQC